MNKWIKKSINLAKFQGYLDKLFKVYPIELGIIRDIPEEIKIKILKAFKDKNKLGLIRALLKLPKFPIDDPYIASLRRHPYLLRKNPKTVERIGKRLLSIDIDTLLRLATKPKSPSRQLGHAFERWLRTTKYPFLKKPEFKKTKRVVFLEGSDEALKRFATEELGIKNLERRPDFILRMKNKFILGEAKFLTDYGGTQNNQFDGALKMTRIKTPRVLGVAILDGIVWFGSNAYMHKTIKILKGIALSALLLEEFIKKHQ